MRLLGYGLIACLALGFLQAVPPVALLLFGSVLLWLGVTRTRETLGFLVGLTALGLINAYPFAGLAMLLAAAGLGLVVASRREAGNR